MRIINAKVQNFASYKELNFDFDEQGLCLIQGPTGSGKSTLCDIIPWVLFGVTAKNGGVDEIRSWNNDEHTEGRVYLQINNTTYGIYRIRGKSNDLYYSEESKEYIRGKDLSDTQKQINKLLGMDADTYLSGAYYHEFSKTAQFFTTTAKNRRLICEQIVDLILAKNLQLKTAENKKTLSNDSLKLEQNIKTLELTLSHISDSMITAEKNYTDFDKNKANKLEQLADLHIKWQEKRTKDILETTQKLESLEHNLAINAGVIKSCKALLNDEVCKECGTHLDNETRQNINSMELERTHRLSNYKKIKEDLQKITNQINPYDKQIEIEQKTENNHYGVLTKLGVKFEKTEVELELANQEYKDLKTKLADIELLIEVIEAYRASQIANNISFIENKTNEYLSNYFDAEIKVVFDVKAADKLEVGIFKDGNECVYTQLSKGQRQLLKLCFSISVMECIQNAKGIKFNSIFLDEALDGLDDILKIKSYRLMQYLALQYSSVFIVEHNAELKALAEKKFIVSINNGVSTIEEA
jgi:DNA repair exonuclease SbcCD ATPase subunit